MPPEKPIPPYVTRKSATKSHLPWRSASAASWTFGFSDSMTGGFDRNRWLTRALLLIQTCNTASYRHLMVSQGKHCWFHLYAPVFFKLYHVVYISATEA